MYVHTDRKAFWIVLLKNRMKNHKKAKNIKVGDCIAHDGDKFSKVKDIRKHLGTLYFFNVGLNKRGEKIEVLYGADSFVKLKIKK